MPRLQSLGKSKRILKDDDLITLIKMIRNSKYKLGQDVGIISLNDTPLKDILEITVISMDFKQMGRTTAELIINRKNIQCKNRFNVYLRSSL